MKIVKSDIAIKKSYLYYFLKLLYPHPHPLAHFHRLKTYKITLIFVRQNIYINLLEKSYSKIYFRCSFILKKILTRFYFKWIEVQYFKTNPKINELPVKMVPSWQRTAAPTWNWLYGQYALLRISWAVCINVFTLGLHSGKNKFCWWILVVFLLW